MASSRTTRTPSTPAQRKGGSTKKPQAPQEVTTEWEEITPARAKEMLESNISNRRLTDSTVKTYARDMAEGRWAVNGEAIQFASDGTLLNGQHRLSAIVLSGVTVPMLVIRGLPKRTQETMDAGKKRNAVDNFTLRGESHTRTLASIARKITLWERGDKSFRDATSPVELSETLEKHGELLRRSAEVAERVHRNFKPLPASVLGTAYFLLHQKAPEDVPWFFSAIERAGGHEEGDPVLTLRERVRRDREEGMRMDDVRLLGYVVRAWNAHREDRKLAQIIHPKGSQVPEIV